MRKLILLLLIATAAAELSGQTDNAPMNLASSLISNSASKLNIGGYATVDVTAQLNSSKRYNPSLDVSRMILSAGYRFSDKTQFLTEVEFEHVKELFVEQAFLNHSFHDWLNLRAGLMLVPMGIINEYHEPTTFNGVLRPALDNIIVPTTWREIGVGFTGRFQAAGLKYQAYLFNGFSSYGSDSKGTLSGAGFLRNGRQRGAKAFASSPNFSARMDYYGIRGLKIGVSGYFGDTQSALYGNTGKDDAAAIARADSSVVGVAMVGADLRYTLKGFHLRGQYVYAGLSNASSYNAFTKSDLGSAVNGFYLEGSFELFSLFSTSHQLTPFLRFEQYDTHSSVPEGTVRQDKYRISEWVFGAGWKPAEGAVFKADVRMRKSGADTSYSTYFNAGIGVWF